MKKGITIWALLAAMAVSVYAGRIEPAKGNMKGIGGNLLPAGRVPGLVHPAFTFSPGESLDFTWYDNQANGSMSRTIALDGVGNGGLHVVYTKAPDGTFTPRNAAYQYNDRAGGGWTGEVDMNTARAGYVTDDALSDGRLVAAFYQTGGGGNHSVVIVGTTTALLDTGPMFPHVAAGPTDVIHVVAHHPLLSDNYYCRSTNQGVSFTPWVRVAGDSMQNPISADVITSRISGKVAVAWTRMRPGGSHMQTDMDIVFIESTDNGATWSSMVNVTNYQVSDTVRAFNDVSGIYDHMDNLHLAWAGRRVIGGTTFYEDAAVFHWSQAAGISLVSGPGHNLPGTFWWSLPGMPGGWSMDVTRPSLSVDTSGKIYCVWSGQVMTNDTGADGYINMDLYGRGSVDNGLTWGAFMRTDTMIYITNSHTPGGPPGACSDDRFTSITKVTTDSVRIFWMEDRDAGSSLNGEGSATSCPIKYLAVKADWFWPSTGVEEKPVSRLTPYALRLSVSPNPFTSFATIPGHPSDRFSLYDVSGRLVGTYKGDRIGEGLSAGVYFLRSENGSSKPVRIVKLR